MSLLYLDELVGRRVQVVEDNLNDNIDIIHIAVSMIDREDLSDLEHMRAYQRKMKQLFNLERFAFVDSDGLIYTADEGIKEEIGQYSFDQETLAAPEISVKNLDMAEKKVVIAVPIREYGFRIEGKPLFVCFMEIACLILTQMGFSVETAENGKLALDMVAASEPGYYDAILMDIQMPVMDGYSAARAIRALDNKALADIPILAMTANAFQEDVKAAMDAGMQAHIAKPVDVGKLTEALSSVLKRP